MKTTLFLLLCLLSLGSARASDLVEILPLTKRVILLHFDDGYARHEARGENFSTTNTLVVSRLNTGAVNTGAFAISSPNDGAFSAARAASNVWRKRKGTDFIRVYPAANPDAYAAYEHWVYLNLPADMSEGKTYTVRWNGSTLNTNVTEATFTLDSRTVRSEALHVNIIGFAPASPKYAYLSHWMGDGDATDFSAYANQPFQVLRAADRSVAFSGTVAFRKDKNNQETFQNNESLRNNFVGSDLYQCDFSALTAAGSYVVSVPGLGCSFPFDIRADAHAETFYWSTKTIYENRSGLALPAATTGFPRPAPHHPGLTPGFGGRLKYSTTRGADVAVDGGGAADKSAIEAGRRGTLDTYGWYQDAGDWDGYLSHTDVPLSLLLAYEANPARWANYRLDIPESSNSLPDLLDEARWLLRYLKRTKDEVAAKGWGTGGVAGTRVFGDYWGADTPNDVLRGSWQDTDRDWYALGEDPWSTYKYAGLAAQFAKVLAANGLTDPEGINWQTEAVNAYTWAASNTRPGDEAKTYHTTLAVARLYAAAALFRLTGNAAYQTRFQQDLPATLDDLTAVCAAFNYLKAPGGAVATQVLATLNANANDNLVASADARGMRFGDTRYMPMLVGQATTPRVWYGIAAYLANQDRGNAALAATYLNAISTTADYFLGGNPLNQCWVSGVGERYPVGVFHLDWFANDNVFVNGPGGDRRALRPKKGFVPYGIWRPELYGEVGWWNQGYAHSSAYPAINPRGQNTGVPNSWPGHEMYFNDRNAPLPAENTIWQTQALASLTYGFLYAVNGAAASPLSSGDGAAASAAATQLFPNPAQNQLQVVYHARRPQQVTIRLLDLKGACLQQLEQQASGGPNRLALPLRLPNGLYLLQIHKDGQHEATRFLVWR